MGGDVASVEGALVDGTVDGTVDGVLGGRVLKFGTKIMRASHSKHVCICIYACILIYVPMQVLWLESRIIPSGHLHVYL